jgi:flagellar hook-associated protein 2
MATITSGVGLFSGLDYASLVDQLMLIEARPRDQILERVSTIDAQRTAFTEISARLTAILSRFTTLARVSTFKQTVGTTSNPSVLSVSTTTSALPGSYSFTVRSLATTHQVVSRGFTSAQASLSAGTVTLESAAAKVDRQTLLEELNGYTGVQRGSFKIIDGEGQEATISINDAQTLADVIDRINGAGIGVRAELSGEGITLQDTTGGSMGLRVREVNDGRVAADLGFAPGNTYSAGGSLEGSALMYLAGTTPTAALNDGLGIRRASAGVDFEIQSSSMFSVKVRLSEIITDTTRLERLNHATGVELGRIRITTNDGQATEVDLSGAQTIGDVRNAIQGAVSGVTVVMAGNRLTVTDSTTPTGEAEGVGLTIEDVEGHAARDLGILGTSTGTKIDGRSVLLVDTLADVLAAINYGDGNQYDVDGNPLIEARIDPTSRRLIIQDHSEGSFKTIISAGSTASQALTDLGFAVGEYGFVGEGAEITGERIIGGLDTVLLSTLNGGQGFSGGTINITANGASVDVDLSGAQTLRDVIELINAASSAAGLQIEAGHDGTGTRLQITNLLDDGSQISVSDVGGNFAESLGLTGTGTRLQSDNLQRQYVSENTRLEDLRQGRGVALGKFRITDASGGIGYVDLRTENAKTLQDVIDAINRLATVNVEARINDTGDGLVLIDNSGGDGRLKVTDESGTTARDLNILGEAEAGTTQIDGSFEFRLEVNAGDTVSDLVARINNTGLASASLINDGSAAAPYRLNLQSLVSGTVGELIVDGGATDLGFGTLTRAQDASVMLGGSLGGGLLLTSSTNTLTDVVDGVSITLTGVSDEPVDVTIARDVDQLVAAMAGLVSDYNSAISRISTLDSYDPDTETKGILFADSTVRTLESRLRRALSGTVSGGTQSTFTRLSQLGVKFGSGGKLEFDEAAFRAAFEEHPEEVKQFFADAETGLAVRLKDEFQRMTETGGLIQRRDSALLKQKELLNERVSRLNDLLTRKRERLLQQFYAMEKALGQLQNQQSALQSIAPLTTSSG